MTQRIIEITSERFIPAETLPPQLSSEFLFDRPCPLALEIGCGTGHFAAELARREPETGVLAIDIYNRGCYSYNFV